MSLSDEQADILGGPLLQRPPNGLLGIFSQHSATVKNGTFFALCLLACLTFVRVREYIRRHRDMNHRKAIRRRYGIPDTDCRPFAVAYAAANRVRAEREAKERNKLLGHAVPALVHHESDQHRNAPMDALHGQRHRRRRLPESVGINGRLDSRGPGTWSDHQRTGQCTSVLDSKRPEAQPLDLAAQYPARHVREAPETVHESSPFKKIVSRRFSRRNVQLNGDATEASRKRLHADESDHEPDTMKKSRIDGGELDDEEETDHYSRPPGPRSEWRPITIPSRNNVHSNGGRNRRVLESYDVEQVDEIMEDVDDEVAGLPFISRGKKRDRLEVESTFGADDEEGIQNEKPSRHRKRRSVSKRKPEETLRGKKRDREVESPEYPGEEGLMRVGHRAQRQKRDKRTPSDEAKSDASMEGTRASLCSDHKVGEEWEQDGIRWKVGDKGQRLRLTLVKKARNKYSMPNDSKHPDKVAAMEIYVEMWMTDEQYREAEEGQELAWQDGRLPPSASRTPEVPGSPKNGKDLLWDSLQARSVSCRPFRPSFTAPSNTRSNPFHQFPSQPSLTRRVTSSASPILAGPAESPTRSSFRSFSKWEKQDREAEAMAKIRAKMQEQKRGQAEAAQTSGLPNSAATSESSTKTLLVPSIILTPAPPTPAEAKAESQVAPTEVKATSSLPTPSPAPESKPALNATGATSGFSTPWATSQPISGSAPTTASSMPSLTKLTQPTINVTTTTAPPSSSVPNFFTKPSVPAASSIAPSTTTSSPFTLTASSHVQTPGNTQTTEGFKTPIFSVAKPSAPLAVPSATSTGPSPGAPPSSNLFAPSRLSALGTGAVSNFSFTAPLSTATPGASSAPSVTSFAPPSAAPSTASSGVGDNQPKSWFGPPPTTATTLGGDPSLSATSVGEAKKDVTPTPVFPSSSGTKIDAAKPLFGASTSVFGAGSPFGTFASNNSTEKQSETAAMTGSANVAGASALSSVPGSGTAAANSSTISVPTRANLFTGSAPSSSKMASSSGFTAGGSIPTFSAGRNVASPMPSNTSNTQPSKPTFSFNVPPPKTTMFGGNNATKLGTPGGATGVASQPASADAKSTFSTSGPGSSATPMSTFSFTAGSGASPFGQPSTSTGAVGQPTSAFGNPACGTLSMLGQPSSTGTSGVTNASPSQNSNDALKPPPAFGNTTGDALSKFGQPSSAGATAASVQSGSLFGGLTAGATPLFGQPSSSGGGNATPSALGAGASSAPSFSFGAPQGGSMFNFESSIGSKTSMPFVFGASASGSGGVGVGQGTSSASAPTTNGTEIPTMVQPQSVFGKPVGSNPNMFGFSPPAGSTLGKPANQNQKQEQ